MARIASVSRQELSPAVKVAFERHVEQYQARVTNMKNILGHSLLAFDVYTQWYPLYEEVEKIVGKRMAYLFAYAISYSADCPLCATFFRKQIIDGGERPESLVLTKEERLLLDFGSSIAKCQGNIADHVYDPLGNRYSKQQIVILVAFAGQMIATNIFNNVMETDMDEFLLDYLPPVRSIWQNAR
ncbi:hypothetical protein LZZ85_18770 [Terrimonas sp. NA20]|uniref:Alkylhydroperoxidase n=1 Tax=Terrimonas ginsenosidimutans TaxID=2908004 RepID=A0ABS9KVL2_9BACT|nr:hypothetical protein [Terrimonas ginsenosidimutans]MCG2616350.1 hypothetical protein [Terrimonas ginsenosidimutans]